MQLDWEERGFSLTKEGPLDMRMDPTAQLTARDVVNTLSEQELGKIFRDLGEEQMWRKGAKAIVQARQKKPIETTTQLASIVEGVISRGGRKIHPATKIFQAIRIFVNRELEYLETTLHHAIEMLNPGGVIQVLSFHSLEDRVVKNVFRDLAAPIRSSTGKKMSEGSIINLTKKPLIPSREELKRNRRARSAKLRCARKKSHLEV